MLFRFWFLDFQSLCLEITVTGVGGVLVGLLWVRYGLGFGMVLCIVVGLVAWVLSIICVIYCGFIGGFGFEFVWCLMVSVAYR